MINVKKLFTPVRSMDSDQALRALGNMVLKEQARCRNSFPKMNG